MIQTYSIPENTIVSLNSVLGIAVGTEIDIVNESSLYNIYLQESVDQPPAGRADKRSVNRKGLYRSSVYIPAGSEEIWAWSPSGAVTISVQVL